MLAEPLPDLSDGSSRRASHGGRSRGAGPADASLRSDCSSRSVHSERRRRRWESQRQRTTEQMNGLLLQSMNGGGGGDRRREWPLAAYAPSIMMATAAPARASVSQRRSRSTSSLHRPASSSFSSLGTPEQFSQGPAWTTDYADYARTGLSAYAPRELTGGRRPRTSQSSQRSHMLQHARHMLQDATRAAEVELGECRRCHPTALQRATLLTRVFAMALVVGCDSGGVTERMIRM